MAKTIYIIRHAEKPGAGIGGVNAKGKPDPESLTPRGWQRAGALADLFAQRHPSGPSAIVSPTRIFGSAREGCSPAPGGRIGSKSKRPEQTIGPLADKLGIDPDLTYSRGQEAEVAAAAMAAPGVVLICWQHEAIPDIAAQILGQTKTQSVPRRWPSKRFDVIWIFAAKSRSRRWRMTQLCQRLLAGDGKKTI